MFGQLMVQLQIMAQKQLLYLSGLNMMVAIYNTVTKLLSSLSSFNK